MDRLELLLKKQKRSKEENEELFSLQKNILKGAVHTRTIGNSILSKNNGENTLDFTLISNDNGGTRYNWAENAYYTEVLDVNGANTDKLNTFFKNHSHDVDSAVGKISNVRVENGELIGSITFGSDAESQLLLAKYKEGILTDVSVGYTINDYTVEKRSATNEQDLVTVNNFEIFEVSAVGIGFDSGAKKRSINLNEDNNMDKELLERLAKLEDKSKLNETEKGELEKLRNLKVSEEKKELEKLKKENDEMKRKVEVEAIAKDFGERGARVLKDNPDVTPEVFRAKLLADFAGESVSKIPNSNTKEQARSKMIDAIVDGLAMRVGAKIEKPAEGADKYRYTSLITIANNILPDNMKSFNPSEVAERSLVTGDFPLLLQSVGARILTTEFAEQQATYQVWMKMVDVPDFRVMQDLTASLGGGRLQKTLENGDLAELSGAEKAESWKIETFGNKFVLTREMLINDDLGAFTNVISTFSRMAKTTANGIAYDILQNVGDYANYKMADGLGIYAPSRKNTTSVALTGDALSKARTMMSKQKGIDGKTPLNITPKFLIVPPELEATAKEIIHATSKIGAGNVNVPNVNQNLYTVVVDAEIKSPTAWYLLADHRTFKMGFLAGTNRQPVIKRNDSSVLRSVFEGVFDIGVMCEDYRGIFRGNV